MNTLRSIQTGLAIALVTAFAFVVSSSAKADEPTDQAADAIEISLDCTMSGPTPSGREWAKLVRSYVRQGQVFCTRTRIGGEAPIEVPSCHSRAAELRCDVVLN